MVVRNYNYILILNVLYIVVSLIIGILQQKMSRLYRNCIFLAVINTKNNWWLRRYSANIIFALDSFGISSQELSVIMLSLTLPVNNKSELVIIFTYSIIHILILLSYLFFFSFKFFSTRNFPGTIYQYTHGIRRHQGLYNHRTKG